MKIDFRDIVISNEFLKTKPSEQKLQKCRESYKEGIMDRQIVINHNNMLIDGYVLYYVLKEAGYDDEIDVVYHGNLKGSPVTYVFGKHEGDDKERCWYINRSYKKMKDCIGHKATVQTRQGLQPITITEVKRSKTPPVEGLIRKVVYVEL